MTRAELIARVACYGEDARELQNRVSFLVRQTEIDTEIKELSEMEDRLRVVANQICRFRNNAMRLEREAQKGKE